MEKSTDDPDAGIALAGRSAADPLALAALRRHAGRAYWLALAAPLLAGVLLVAQAAELAGILERAVVAGEPPATLVPALALLALTMLARFLVGAVGERAGIRSAERIKLWLRSTLFARLMAAPPSWADSRSSGALSTALVEQADAVEGFFARFYPAMIQAALLPIAFAAVALPVDWLVALLFLVTAPLIPVFMALVGWGAQAATERQAEALSRLGGRFADRLSGLVTLKLFGRAEAETAAMRAAGEELRIRTMRVLRIAFLSSAVLEFFAALGVAGVALYVGLTFLGLVGVHPGLGYGAGLFLLLLAPEVYNPLRLLAAHYHDRAAARAAMIEIARQFGDDALLPPATAATGSAAPANGDILVAGLTLRTPDGRRTVLDHLDLAAPAGAAIAILGGSGGGKTTLLEALARLRLSDGAITLGGAGLAVIDEATLRRDLAFLPQRPRLFHGSIADNIRLGRPDAPDADVARAAITAGVGLFADGLPDGLATMIGEKGFGLSGGEAQRVALARIYLRDPRFILLDEPTAHLDAATEARVADGLLVFAEGRTLLVATHSLALAARMDEVLRLAGGRLLPTPLGARGGARPARGSGVIA
ncbi:MAG: thiol reductant ABC exporter subunit CydD [Rhizobiales bacterium]|nr:thiol reductant ABC exporter subunit CydD [Hyphomicrobiales bacterium]